MAIGIHVVYLAPKSIGSAGSPLNKSTATIGEVGNSSLEVRVVPDTGIPNSANYPTIKRYLELEAADNFVVRVLTQTMIVTYDVADINAA